MINSSVCGILLSTCIIAMLQLGAARANSTLTCGDDENPCIRENFLYERAFSEIVDNITEVARTPNLECKALNLCFYYDESIEDCDHCSNICSLPASVNCLEKCEGCLVKVDADRKIEEFENRINDELFRLEKMLLNSEKNQDINFKVCIALVCIALCCLLALTVVVIVCVQRNNKEREKIRVRLNKCEDYLKDPHPVTNSDDCDGANSEHARLTTSNGRPASCQS